jgi:PAS domain S-box-containing protein
MVSWDTVVHLGQVGAAIITLTTLLAGVYKYALKPYVVDRFRDAYKKITHMSKQIADNYDGMEKALPAIMQIAEEFKPNHGSSLRDAINRIENTMCNLQASDHLLLNLSEIAHFQTDQNGNCIWANLAYCNLTALDLIDIKGHGWISVVHPEDRKVVTEEWERTIEEKRQFNMTYRYMTTSGKVFPVRVHAILNFNTRGEIVGALGSVFPL